MENDRNEGGIISCRFKRIDNKVLMFRNAFSSCSEDNGFGGIYPSYEYVNKGNRKKGPLGDGERETVHLGAKMPCHSRAPLELYSDLG